jgi:hypothetical protein
MDLARLFAEKGYQYVEDRNNVSSRTVRSYIEARFLDSELRSFEIKIFYSRTPNK